MNAPRILVTEDEMIVAMDLEKRLRRLGYEVLGVVPTGEEALEQARMQRPDLLLMDIMLQGEWDGIQTAERIRAEQDVPVIYLTANADNQTLRRAQDSQASSYLLKPIRERELQICIEMALSNHALKRQLQEVNELLETRVRQRTAELAKTNQALQQEVHERQQAELAASEWRRRYELAVVSSRQAVYDLDLATGTVVWGAGAERVLGRAVEGLELHREQWFCRVHAADVVQAVARLEEAQKQGTSFDVEYRLQNADGRYEWMQDSGLFARNEQGMVTRMLGILRNIHERKTAEDKIREQAALLDSAQDAIMVRDLQDRVLYWNRSAERLYGWTAAQAQNRPVAELLLRGDHALLWPARLATLQSGEWSGERTVYTKDGRELTVHSRWTLLRGDAGQPRAFLVAHTDLTEKKLLEAKFLRAQRLESIGALAGGIAHDLNNVFTPILMSAQLLDDHVSDPTDHKMLDVLQTSARRGSEMVKQILTFARGVTASDAVVQIKHLVNDIERMARGTFPPQIRVCANVARGLWSVRGDATQVHQVLMNLCINARDAMAEGGTLTIEARNFEPGMATVCGADQVPAKQYVQVIVSDTGTGMPPEVRQRIFEPFFTPKEPGKGTGLGLPTVLSIVRAHGGFVDVKSEVGRGTQFQILLPADCSAQDAAGQARPEPPPNGSGETILVVDDESVIREIVKTTLEAHGYEVLLAGEGTEALALYAAHRDQIALVLADMMMPFMDGPATIRALRKLDPNVKVLAASGVLDQEKVPRMLAPDSVPFLSKPYSAQGLLTTIHRLLHVQAN